MIQRDLLEEIGRFNKPHGIRGEISATIEDIDPDELPCIFVEIEGLFVPFFIESVRTKGSETYLLSIKGINNEADGLMLAGHTIYAEAEVLGTADDEADGFYLSDLEGFALYDGPDLVGTIEDFDDSTDNVLFIVRRLGAEKTLFVPAAEEMITDINNDSKTITMDLPVGLLDL